MSFSHECIEFQLDFVAMIQERDFQPMQQQSPVLAQFAVFKIGSATHQPHLTHGITFPGSLKALFQFTQSNSSNFSCSLKMLFFQIQVVIEVYKMMSSINKIKKAKIIYYHI